jgi:serine/threonine-protein kinase ATR
MKYGDPNKALLILEPTEPDVTAIRNKLRKVKSLDNLGYLEGATERLYLGKKLLLAAQIMTQSRVRHGTAITDRFKLAISLLNDKEPAHFALANYYEDLLSHSTGSNDSDENDETYCKNLYLAIENYVFSIMSGSEHLMQSLPKLITLWLTVTSPNFSINNNASQSNFKSTQTNKKGESKSAESSLISRVSAHVNVKLRKACNDIPAHVWYRCMPQIVSRIGHSNTETLNIIKEILVKIIVSFPQQGIWHMSSQIHSLNTERKKHSKAIVASAISKLQQSNDTTNADMLNDATPLFHSIVSLAQLIPQSSAGNKINVDIGKNCNLSRFLVPTQAALTMCDACSPALKNPSLRNDTGNVYFPSDQASIFV